MTTTIAAQNPNAGTQAGPALNVGERLDRLSVGSFHWKILLLIGGGLLVDVYDQMLGGAVLAAMVKAGQSNLQLNGYFLSGTFLGLMVGAWFAGVLSDRFGRRLSFQINLLIFGLASAAAFFAPDMNWLIALRFIMCIGLGAEVVVASSTLMEFLPTSSRGRLVATLGLTSALGALIANAAGYYVVPSYGWQWMFAIGAVSALLVWFARQTMPESPRWLEAKGRYAEAEAIVRQMEGANYQPCQPIGVKPPVAKPDVSAAVLFTGPVIRRSIVAILLNFAIQVSVWMMTAWMPTFLIKQGLQLSSSLGMATLMSCGALAGTLIAILVIEHIPRRLGLVLGCLTCVVSAAYLPYSPSLEISLVAGIVLSMGIYYLITVGYNIYVNEIFPTEFRQRGTGLAIASGRFVLFLTPWLIVPLFQWGGLQAVFPIIVILNFIAPIVLMVWGPETGKRSLEDVTQQVSKQVAQAG